MIHDRALYWGYSYLHQAGHDPAFCKVYAACTMIKAAYVNSVMRDFSYRKFAKLIGKRFYVAKEILNLGERLGFFSIYKRKDKNGKKTSYLRVTKRLYELEDENNSYTAHVIKLGVITPKDKNKSAQIFLLSAKAVKYKKYNNYNKYAGSAHQLNLDDVIELILLCNFFPILKGHFENWNRDLCNRLREHGSFNLYKKMHTKKQMESVREVILDDFEKRETNLQNTGISYKYIVDKFPEWHNIWGGMSDYKVAKIIRKWGIEDGVIETSSNYLYMMDCKKDRHDHDDFGLPEVKGKVAKLYQYMQKEELIRQAKINDYFTCLIDYRTGELKHIDLRKRGFHAPKYRKESYINKDGKIRMHKAENPNRYKVYIRMANSYQIWDGSSTVIHSHTFHVLKRMDKKIHIQELRKEAATL